MKKMRALSLTALVVVASTVAMAHGGPWSGAGMGMGMGPGHGGMRGQAGPAGAEFTPGWALLSEQERIEHRDRLLAAKTPEERSAYMAQHRELLAARAKEQGKTLGMPGCGGRGWARS